VAGRLLFVCGVNAGGAYRSTLELVGAMRKRGYDIEFIATDIYLPRRARLAHRLLNLETHLKVTPMDRPIRWFRHRIGRKPRWTESEFGPVGLTATPESAVVALGLERGFDAAVITTMPRSAWREIKFWAAEHAIPSMLYLRGVDDLLQLDHPDGVADMTVANTKSVAATANERGVPTRFIPSPVDLAPTRTSSSRCTALFISPTESRGLGVALALAEARPDVAFVFQTAWDVGASAWSDLHRRTNHLPNVEIRQSAATPSEIYADAKVLLTPHQIDNRPRVILEAQSNSIPVLSSDQPGLRDQMGDGGLLVAPDAPIDDWVAAFSSLWDDQGEYDRRCKAALEWSQRTDQDPQHIVDSFEAAVADLIAGAARA